MLAHCHKHAYFPVGQRRMLTPCPHNGRLRRCGAGGDFAVIGGHWSCIWTRQLCGGPANEPSMGNQGQAATAVQQLQLWAAALHALWETMPSTCGHHQSWSATAPCNAALRVCSRARQWSVALAVLEAMRARRIPLSTGTYSAAAGALGGGGRWEVALALLQRMPMESLRPDVINFNAVISACAADGEWRMATQVLRAMGDREITPDTVGYNATISACARGAATHQALLCMLHMRSATLPPTAVTYSSAMSAMSRAGQWAAVLHLLSDMASMGATSFATAWA